ncbi:CinA family protein [Phenylobacterium immobile]|uniref:CinA family protein n=1 Tax=Phenylobacterium immobile TaxID=21 RepID=UPI000B873C3E|nr:CinA family protein [Phenylobacterium immobile]
MFPQEIKTVAEMLVDAARDRHLRIVTAESCTGGLVAAAITSIPGSSEVFDRGFVTYSNRAKQEMLGVAGDLIADMGAVSEPVVRAMAEGALARSNGLISVAITGVAGPGGGSAFKPVGTVHFATALTNQDVRHREFHFNHESREAVQMAATLTALQLLVERAEI